MSTHVRKPGEFTGRHMIAIMLAFFGTIVAVNVTLAAFARSSWTGLVVENAYVASQNFNEQAAAGKEQAALGWKGTLTIGKDGIRYLLADKAGALVAASAVTVKLQRLTHASEDRVVTLARVAGGAFATGDTLRDGVWIVEIDADVAKAVPYRDVRRVVVRNGEMR